MTDAIVVVVTQNNPAAEVLAARLLPPTAETRVGADRVYRWYRGSSRAIRLHDSDGTMIVESHCFATEAAARRWVRKDEQRRRGRVS